LRKPLLTKYVANAESDQVETQAHLTVIDAIDLALVAGQYPADVDELAPAITRI